VVRNWHRSLLGLAAAGVLVFGIVAVAVSSRGHASAIGSTFTIEITSTGFNPQTCTVNRNDSEVQFLNKDTKPHRVVIPRFADPNPDNPSYDFDSGFIAPGETGGHIRVTGQLEWHYQDFDDPSKTGNIIAPPNNNAGSNCSPQTPTPTRTPTPVATPTPQRPPACYRGPGCVVAPGVTKEESN